jgi:hypothetical protein
LSFRSAAFSREESAVSLLAASRFLADNAGFGMTRDGWPKLIRSPKISSVEAPAERVLGYLVSPFQQTSHCFFDRGFFARSRSHASHPKDGA